MLPHNELYGTDIYEGHVSRETQRLTVSNSLIYGPEDFAHWEPKMVG